MARPKDAFISRNSSLPATPVRINDPDRLKASPGSVVKEAVRKSINTIEKRVYSTGTGIVLRVEEVSRPASMGPYSDKRLVNKYFEGEEKFYVLITRMFDYNQYIPYDPAQIFKKDFAAKTLTQRMQTKVYATSADFTDGIPQPGDYIIADFLDTARGIGAVYRNSIARNMNIDAEDGDSTEPCDDVRRSIQRLLDSQSQPIAEEEVQPEPTSGENYAQTYQRPIDNIVTSEYGMREGAMHFGTDLRAAIGTAIRAPYDGTITNVNNTNQLKADGSPGAGYVVWFDTDPIQDSTEWNVTLRMKFFHLAEPGTIQAGYPLPEGTQVTKGDIIAYSGNTDGTATGGDPHLHWEVFRNGVRIDPMTLPGVQN